MDHRIPIGYTKGVVATVDEQIEAMEAMIDAGRSRHCVTVLTESMGGSICQVHVFPADCDLATARSILGVAIEAIDDMIGPADRRKGH